ncbi:MAG TPA: DNA methyltransferase [Roseiflexaceae bacterium]|nr:DNA methyltransferase [Roseiflexaceae bacterium]
MAPLRRKWVAVQAECMALATKDQGRTTNEEAGTTSVRPSSSVVRRIQSLLLAFAHEIASVRVLDPACGSGNFLYVALKQLLDLEKEVIRFAADIGVGGFFPSVSPEQLRGIEINEYAHELASTTVWIGYIQWLRDNGFGAPSQPILKALDTIVQMDALMAFDDAGQPCAPAWPEADVIVGNPPFVGGNKVRQELGDAYVDALFRLYDGRVPAFADLVTYFFERARALIEAGEVQRAGLLATNSIRGGANRKVLERIKQSGDIFMAWSDRPWILDGAAVRVSMVGFDGGQHADATQSMQPMLNGAPVAAINADLTGDVNLAAAKHLVENETICFRSDEKGGPFDIDAETAQKMLAAPLNPNNRPNSDVVRPYVNGLDVTRRSRNVWVIDFGVDMSEEDASLYELPFEHVRQVVKPVRNVVRNERERTFWWLHRRPAPDMRIAIRNLSRFIATPSVAKHRLFVWLDSQTIPDHQLYVIAREDDYFFGVLHSRAHELWALRMGTSLEDRPRYTPTTTFETFPFPWPPGTEPADDPRVAAIAEAARELVEKRERWLNPEGASEAELKKRTLTNLYNQRPAWLDMAHRKLDRAVFAAYGWPDDLSDEAILERLLALNRERAAAP